MPSNITKRKNPICLKDSDERNYVKFAGINYTTDIKKKQTSYNYLEEGSKWHTVRRLTPSKHTFA